MDVVRLEGTNNMRDLGGTPVDGGRRVRPGLLYRGGALHALTPADVHELFETRGVRCIVDLRCGWERAEKPDVVVPGVVNLHIPFYDAEIVGIEYTEPGTGAKVVGRDVACNPLRFYRSLANELTVGQMRLAVGQVLDHAANGEPVLVHCNGGKDRAGILSLLVLTVLGASRQAVLEDYLFTNVARDANYEVNYQRFFGICGDEQQARELTEAHRARPENLDAFYAAVSERYGDMDAFIANQLEISEGQREAYRAALTM